MSNINKWISYITNSVIINNITNLFSSNINTNNSIIYFINSFSIITNSINNIY